jgi:hypothetical protein
MDRIDLKEFMAIAAKLLGEDWDKFVLTLNGQEMVMGRICPKCASIIPDSPESMKTHRRDHKEQFTGF